MNKVESFELDHRKVKAPYIRKCCFINPKSPLLYRFDTVTFDDNKSDLSSLSQYFTIQQSVELNIFQVNINLNCNIDCTVNSQKVCLYKNIHFLYNLVLI